MKKLLIISILLVLFATPTFAGPCLPSPCPKPQIKIYTEKDYGCSCGSIQAFIANLSADPEVVYVHYQPDANSTPGEVLVVKRGTGCVSYDSFEWCSDNK